jgi:hypothetical protein
MFGRHHRAKVEQFAATQNRSSSAMDADAWQLCVRFPTSPDNQDRRSYALLWQPWLTKLFVVSLREDPGQ